MAYVIKVDQAPSIGDRYVIMGSAWSKNYVIQEPGELHAWYFAKVQINGVVSSKGGPTIELVLGKM